MVCPAIIGRQNTSSVAVIPEKALRLPAPRQVVIVTGLGGVGGGQLLAAYRTRFPPPLSVV
jgi:hypothetical protein